MSRQLVGIAPAMRRVENIHVKKKNSEICQCHRNEKNIISIFDL